LAGAPLAAFGTLPINARSRRFIHFVQQCARAREAGCRIGSTRCERRAASKIDRSGEVSHLKFAKKFGLLTDRASEDTSYWPEAIERMRGLINLDRANWMTRDGRYESYEVSRHFTLRFQPKGTDEMELSVAPANLRAALTLQCLAHRAGGARTRSCKECGEVFEVGGASGSRSHKAFCSDSCRFNFNNRRKSAGPC
jgi:hypothetical protein